MLNTLTNDLSNLMHSAPFVILATCFVCLMVGTVKIFCVPKIKMRQIDPNEWKGGK